MLSNNLETTISEIANCRAASQTYLRQSSSAGGNSSVRCSRRSNQSKIAGKPSRLFALAAASDRISDQEPCSAIAVRPRAPLSLSSGPKARPRGGLARAAMLRRTRRITTTESLDHPAIGPQSAAIPVAPQQPPTSARANFLAASTPLGTLKGTVATLSFAAIFPANLGSVRLAYWPRKTSNFAPSRRRPEQID